MAHESRDSHTLHHVDHSSICEKNSLVEPLLHQKLAGRNLLYQNFAGRTLLYQMLILYPLRQKHAGRTPLLPIMVLFKTILLSILLSIPLSVVVTGYPTPSDITEVERRDTTVILTASHHEHPKTGNFFSSARRNLSSRHSSS
ncbi:hypothetical protein F5880DRAFT_1734994 [Lentinula raphanica]|nr:hypothetical protein F5880DRAFT_1734994 [Lentinula raphanica]